MSYLIHLEAAYSIRAAQLQSTFVTRDQYFSKFERGFEQRDFRVPVEVSHVY